MEILNALADIAAILTLLVTGFVAYTVKNIQKNSSSGNHNKMANQAATGNGNIQKVTQ